MRGQNKETWFTPDWESILKNIKYWDKTSKIVRIYTFRSYVPYEAWRLRHLTGGEPKSCAQRMHHRAEGHS